MEHAAHAAPVRAAPTWTAQTPQPAQPAAPVEEPASAWSGHSLANVAITPPDAPNRSPTITPALHIGLQKQPAPAQTPAQRITGILQGQGPLCDTVTAAVADIGGLPVTDVFTTLEAVGPNNLLPLPQLGGQCNLPDTTTTHRGLALSGLVVAARGPSSGAREAEIALRELGRLPQADTQAILTEFGNRYGQEALEGLSVLAQASSSPVTPADAQSQGGVAAGTTIPPGPWAPPGGQPIPFYIGNQAHIGIAAYYVSHHPGEVVFTNFIPLSTIIAAARGNAGALGAADLALRPDIFNLSTRVIYEIKPAGAEAQAVRECAIYVAALTAAGVSATPGPQADSGVRGAVPAPGGYYVFWSPLPGAIVYRYGRGPLTVPVPHAVPRQAPTPQGWEWVLAIIAAILLARFGMRGGAGGLRPAPGMGGGVLGVTPEET